MANIKNRVERLEEHHAAHTVKPGLAFTWWSPADDDGLEAARRQAEAEGRILIVARIVDTPACEEHHGEH